MTKYKIVRFYQNPDYPQERVKTGLTLEEAQKHCKDPNTNSRTCRTGAGRMRTKKYGAWFEGYTKE